MNENFRVGVSPDFYTDARGRFEAVLEEKLGLPGIEWEAMPELPGGLATPEALDRYDAIFTLAIRIAPESLAGVRRVALIARWGVGYDKLDVAALTRADVLLTITPNAVRTPVAEAILALVLALAKNLRTQDRFTRQGKWRGDLPSMGRNLRGQVLGSIGMGNIGREMFRLAEPFGFSRRIACDPYVAADSAAGAGVARVSLEEALGASDFLAVNCPLNDHTRGLIGENELRLMKPTAYLVNTARGSIVREAALLRALREGWIAGAGLDVWEQEPPPKDHPFLALDNVIVAPHALAWTHELARDNGREACDSILALARGELPSGIVNRDVLDRPGFRAKLARYGRRG
jgi:phosphoglycerate dehydrogenase-like enzyme